LPYLQSMRMELLSLAVAFPISLSTLTAQISPVNPSSMLIVRTTSSSVDFQLQKGSISLPILTSNLGLAYIGNGIPSGASIASNITCTSHS
jgi:hypothetical protein